MTAIYMVELPHNLSASLSMQVLSGPMSLLLMQRTSISQIILDIQYKMCVFPLRASKHKQHNVAKPPLFPSNISICQEIWHNAIVFYTVVARSRLKTPFEMLRK